MTLAKCAFDRSETNAYPLNSYPLETTLTLIRTRWKILSDQGLCNSYPTEKNLSLIRTSWKNRTAFASGKRKFPFNINTHNFKSGRRAKNPLIRTWRKRILHRVEIYLHSTEKRVFEIRTWRKESSTRVGHKLKFLFDFNAKLPFRLITRENRLIRTPWKRILHRVEMNSYSMENFLGLIRTPRNLIRTWWKREVDFIQESAFFGLPINTSLYISKGNE